MYEDEAGYKHFISEKQFNGTLGDLFEEITEAFVNEEIRVSKLGEFYNIAGLLILEKYGEFGFNIGIDIGLDGELDMDGVLEEELIKEKVIMTLLHKIGLRSRELHIGGHIGERDTMFSDSNIKGTYTLAYS